MKTQKEIACENWGGAEISEERPMAVRAWLI